MKEHYDGEWVLYDALTEATAAKDAEIERLAKELGDTQERLGFATGVLIAAQWQMTENDADERAIVAGKIKEALAKLNEEGGRR
ncbi:MAG: hypothetical protein AAF432_00645 [Planctomycetota bacterium]